MLIYFVRHGIAEDAEFLQSDSERALTPEGIRKMQKVGSTLAELDLAIETIISSPYVRARQTAEIIVEEISFKKELVFDKRIIPSASFKEFGNLLQEMSTGGNMMFVGHEPSISSFVSGICADHALRMDFKKGAVCCIELTNSNALRGNLKWYATPAQLIKKK